MPERTGRVMPKQAGTRRQDREDGKRHQDKHAGTRTPGQRNEIAGTDARTPGR